MLPTLPTVFPHPPSYTPSFHFYFCVFSSLFLLNTAILKASAENSVFLEEKQGTSLISKAMIKIQ